MSGRGAIVVRGPDFAATVKSLADLYPDLESAVDDFVEALAIGGEDLPAHRVSDHQRIHYMDVPSLGASGRGLMAVTWMVSPPAAPGGKPTFKLVDMWPRPDGTLYDPDELDDLVH